MDLTNDESALYAKVPADGTTIGNKNAQSKLRWDDDTRYWTARDGLVGRGLVVRGRGRGGTLRRAESPAGDGDGSDVGPEVSVKTIAAIAVEAIQQEAALYEPIKAVLLGAWAKDHQSNPVSVEITASQGRRATGGRWSRPDLVLVEVKNYLHLPTKILDIRTFEVKPSSGIDVQAVYEALAHRRAATHAYVVLHVPKDSSASLEDDVTAVREVARFHGVGVVVIDVPGDYATWDEVEEAVRYEPDPERLDAFIRVQLNETTKAGLISALR